MFQGCLEHTSQIFWGCFVNVAAVLLSLCLDLPSGSLTTRPLSMMDSFMET